MELIKSTWCDDDFGFAIIREKGRLGVGKGKGMLRRVENRLGEKN